MIDISDRFDRLIEFGRFLKMMNKANMQVGAEMLRVKEELERELGLWSTTRKNEYEENIKSIVERYQGLTKTQKDLWEIFNLIHGKHEGKLIIYPYKRGTGATIGAISLLKMFDHTYLYCGVKHRAIYYDTLIPTFKLITPERSFRQIPYTSTIISEEEIFIPYKDAINMNLSRYNFIILKGINP